MIIIIIIILPHGGLRQASEHFTCIIWNLSQRWRTISMTYNYGVHHKIQPHASAPAAGKTVHTFAITRQQNAIIMRHPLSFESLGPANVYHDVRYGHVGFFLPSYPASHPRISFQHASYPSNSSPQDQNLSWQSRSPNRARGSFSATLFRFDVLNLYSCVARERICLAL